MPQSSQATEYGVETHELTRRFTSARTLLSRSPQKNRTVLAVDRVNLRIDKGEVFGLVGPNGAGKTTLIKMLSTLLLPSSGSASVGHFDIVNSGHRVRRLVGLVASNERSFYWRLTGRQNMVFFADLYQIEPAEGRAWMNELFVLLGIEDIIDKRFDSYSTGQRQRLAMARGLLSKPKILFMDEPTKGVDPIGAAETIDIIRNRVVDLWHPTILVTSHNLTEIERLCSRIAVMHKGRIVALGDLEQLRDEAGLVVSYRLTVARLSNDQLRRAAASGMAREPIALEHHNNAADLEVRFPRGADGFSQVIRSIVEQGGDVLTCRRVDKNLDDVFRSLIDGDEESNGNDE